MRVCVATTVHHPEDARIMHRQIRALLDAGHEVTYVAPFTHFNVTPAMGLTAIDVPHRAGYGRAGGALRRGAAGADLLMVHDHALLRALPHRRPPVVWDVREDVGARRLARAERRHHLCTAELVPEATFAATAPPPPGDTRVVHLGRLSAERGVAELIALARRLAPHGIRMDLIGAADPAVRPLLRDAQRVGLLDWFGYVPNRHALRMTGGALAGLSLAAPAVEGVPAKVLDYMGRGVPVVTTPQAGPLVERVGCGVVVPLDVAAVSQAVLDLKEDPVRRSAFGTRGHAEARLRHHWPDQAAAFVARMEAWAGVTAPARPVTV
ncbi:glycosyltransferase [Nonomuraea muscovyensis]|uniref:Glycosyltransferase involved in cell wall biosynthesis n=1 Tax=Nonomuraea muscovyensis TaxID=1124761 RepID=A0A7X0C9U1_9ACTN|nr:glycosyltransferase [Nonomuraea muscovyensis]MBB6350738.1 glycosyltransferase involved in cell wall biosynthesis [Nonomuraea muscovyensis]